MSANDKRIVIVDIKIGNLFNVERVCRHVGLNPIVSSNKADILSADALILPGVGAFGDAMENLRSMDLEGPLKDVIQSGKPLLGICLGMQILFSQSHEFGTHKGLGVIQGEVLRFAPKTADGELMLVPQVGWNSIRPASQSWENSPLRDTKPGEHMYFVHSYYTQPEDQSVILSKTVYGDLEYCSSIRRGNIVACQFHPERSGVEGLKLYRNWAESLAKTAK